jgi:hypothetical protein
MLLKAADVRADGATMSQAAAIPDYHPALPAHELVTVRVGKGTKLHAMTRDGAGMCAVVGRVRMFARGSTEIVKVEDGTDDVDCTACVWGLKYDAAFAFPEGKLL